MRSLRIVAVFALFSTFIFNPFIYSQEAKAQDEKVQEEKPLDATAIYEYYKDCVVDIETTLTLENGTKLQFGGSGFFVENDGKKEGHVATVSHVVKQEGDIITIGDFFGMGKTVKIVNYEYYVILSSKNRKYKAELVGANVYDDVAALRAIDADPADYNAARLSLNSGNLKPGEPVYAIGMPYGLSNNLTHGIISALHRYIDLWYVEDFIGMDTPINPGNSGGPLIDSKGNVVGFNDAVIRGADGMGFAVPINKFNLDELKKNGTNVMPWFGAEAMIENFPRMGKTAEEPSLRDLRELYNETGLDPESLYELAKLTYKDNWAVVNKVDQTVLRWGKVSPARMAGIKRGDLIVKIDGKPIKGGMDVRQAIMKRSLGDSINIELIRFEYGVSKKLTVRVKLDQKQPEKSAPFSGNKKTIILRKDGGGEYGLFVPLPNSKSVEAALLVKVKILK